MGREGKAPVMTMESDGFVATTWSDGVSSWQCLDCSHTEEAEDVEDAIDKARNKTCCGNGENPLD